MAKKLVLPVVGFLALHVLMIGTALSIAHATGDHAPTGLQASLSPTVVAIR